MVGNHCAKFLNVHFCAVFLIIMQIIFAVRLIVYLSKTSVYVLGFVKSAHTGGLPVTCV